ncbi:protein TraD [Legionella moravica]|uniref:Protein TraD n=1 Tax=Legionella moravica TaxID=39962 RepID=A0A378JRC3_9GAMM|nr:conjugal transfer protein TraD [Legionella moravica]KTD34659.1 protein TraD [Legionella moravica]STX61265.1 protein TraD [Legionella moravica]
MTMLAQIEKEKQTIARCKKSLAIEKIKKRRADTRYKIELGGLVIKSSMNRYDKGIILGALVHVFHLINENQNYLGLFKSIGDNLFLENRNPSKIDNKG